MSTTTTGWFLCEAFDDVETTVTNDITGEAYEVKPNGIGGLAVNSPANGIERVTHRKGEMTFTFSHRRTNGNAGQPFDIELY